MTKKIIDEPITDAPKSPFGWKSNAKAPAKPDEKTIKPKPDAKPDPKPVDEK